MVERAETADPRWAAVDAYVTDRLLGDDPVLARVLAANAAAGLPDIDVSPAQGRMLELLARMLSATAILEIGTLGGYSTICLARALPADGRLVSLEIDPHHARVAHANLVEAGLAGRVEIVVGPAMATLPELSGPFDFAFIDADKPSNVEYLTHTLRLVRPGGAIVVDNVVREGGVLDSASEDDRIRGTRALFDAVAAEPRLRATAVQTVGVKKWDGFLLAIVAAMTEVATERFPYYRSVAPMLWVLVEIATCELAVVHFVVSLVWNRWAGGGASRRSRTGWTIPRVSPRRWSG